MTLQLLEFLGLNSLNSSRYLLQFFTESNFLAPHMHTANMLAKHANPVYAYVFDQETPDPNIYSGSINATGILNYLFLNYLIFKSFVASFEEFVT